MILCIILKIAKKMINYPRAGMSFFTVHVPMKIHIATIVFPPL